MQYYRTFIAMPVEVGKDLLQLRREIMSGLEAERISWVDPANFHITLRFMGDTRVSEVERIAASMISNRFIQEARSFPVTGIFSFGPTQKPRVIWAGFGLELWFSKMKAEVDDWLEDLGFPAQDQVFTAHLTLGRIRSLSNVSGFHAFMEGLKSRNCGAVSFSSLVYYRSVLGSGRPEYSKLAELPFEKK